MLIASPHSMLTQTQSAHQSMLTGARRNMRLYPQGDSFGVVNTTLYFSSYSASRPKSLAKTGQTLGNFRIHNVRGVSLRDDKFYYNSAQDLIEKYISGSFLRAVHTSESILSIVQFGLITSSQNFGTWLQEALQELDECPLYAQEEEIDEPSDVALTKARELLEKVSNSVIDRPEIYPMQEGSIAIDFRSSCSKSGVLFLIERDGSGALYHRTASSKGRLRVDDAADLLKEGGFRELKRVGVQ
ncbi:MAG: hypothetical protein OXC68_06105 [Aestuariivita sp.]|nr:hypothetical protein [Aestuariivita sp.]